MSQVVCRIQKLKSSGEVGAVGAHNSRTQTDGYRHVDPKAPKPISLKGGGDLVAEVSARIGDRKIRKNAVIAVEFVLSASPEYFRPGHETEWGKYDKNKLDDWVASQRKFLAEQFGEDNVVDLSLHIDEATPHIHAVIVPIRPDDGKLAASHWFDGPAKMRILQDSAAEHVSHLGIKRGDPFSAAEHVSQQQFYAAAAQPVPYIPPITTPKQPAAAQEPSIFSRLTKDGSAEYEEWYNAEAIKDELRRKRSAEIQASKDAKLKVYPLLAQQAKGVEIARKGQKEAESRATHYRAENERLKTESARLRGVELSDVLAKIYGATESKDSKPNYKSRKFDIEGLSSPFGISEDLWIDNNTGKGGRGAIDLVSHLSGVDFQGAVATLREFYGAEGAVRAAVSIAARRAEARVDAVPDMPPGLPERVENRWKSVRDWLVNARKLPGLLVDSMYANGIIYANKLAGCVFKRDLAGYCVRGIGDSRFKQTNGRYEQCGAFTLEGNGDVWLVEAPIDAMSVKAIHSDAHVIATLGTSGVPLHLLNKIIPIGRDVVVAMDNDKPGEEKSIEMLRSLYACGFSAHRERSMRKDWNADLQEGFAAVDKLWLPERHDALLSEKAQEPTKKPNKPNNSGPSF